MYQNLFIQHGNRDSGEQTTVYLWDDEKGLMVLPYDEFDYAYKFDAKGTFKTITGSPVKKVKRYKREDTVYESDLPRETRILSDLYLDDDMPSKNHRILTLDIEVDSTGGHGSPSTALKEITAISVGFNRKYIVFLLDKEGTIEPMTLDGVEVIPFKTEKKMIMAFLDWYREVKPTIITGWNIDSYDIPYLFNRIRNVFDAETAMMLSEIGYIRFNKYKEKFVLAGTSCLDYIKLYRKFTFGERENYKLETIAMYELKKGKVKYEGTLDNLYKTDKHKFIQYTANDVILVDELDDKMKLIALAQFVCHLGHVPYEDFEASSKFIEGTIVCYLHRKGIVVPNKMDVTDEEMEELMYDAEEKFEGAYVKEPIAGLYKWAYGIDLESLYPSIIMSLNISPETKVGKVLDWNVEQHIKIGLDEYHVELVDDTKATYTKEEFVEWLTSNNLMISSLGILYSSKQKGIIPEILEKWFAERKEFRALAQKYSDEGNKELEEFYDRRQYVQKVFLNSIYGVLGLPAFRFYDVDNAESVTVSGQDIIKSTEKLLNNWYNKELGTTGVDYCIYIDTDSNYFITEPFQAVRSGTPFEVCLEIAKEAETRANGFYSKLAKMFFNCDKHRLKTKAESVIETGFWVGKKNYAMKKVYDIEKDKPITNPEKQLVIKGMASVRSDFPEAFKKLMIELTHDVLDFIPKEVVDAKIAKFEKDLPKMELFLVMNNKGIKNIEKWDDKKVVTLNNFKPKTPAHVRAAINYNRYLKLKKLDTSYETIKSGDKIKYVVLKKNPFNLKYMALKVDDDPPEILDMVTTYIDYDKLLQSQLTKKMEKWYEALKWGKLAIHVNQNLDDFFTF